MEDFHLLCLTGASGLSALFYKPLDSLAKLMHSMYRKTIHTGAFMNILELREKIQTDLFSYVELTELLSSYSNIRTKIQRLIDNGDIIRLKKGIYMFPEALRREPLNPAMVANIIYGPSYVSCDYALSYYGLIPESVVSVCSMTTGRSREFDTPVGHFQYLQRKASDYSVGIVLENGCLFASMEKAIYDKALTDRRFDGCDIGAYLEQDLRIDISEIPELNHDILQSLMATARGKMKKLVTHLETL